MQKLTIQYDACGYLHEMQFTGDSINWSIDGNKDAHVEVTINGKEVGFHWFKNPLSIEMNTTDD